MHEAIVDTFLQECEDLLPEIEECALALSDEGEPDEIVGRLFRAFHTIKGSGAMVGFDHVASFTHHVETLLDGVREGKVAISPRIAELVLAAADEIKRLLTVEPGDTPAPSKTRDALVVELEQFAAVSKNIDGSKQTSQAPHDSAQQGNPPAGQERGWKITFRPNSDLFTCGGNPYLLIRELGKLGTVDAVALTEDVPPLEDLQPNLCYLGWSITLRTAEDENTIRDVFVFVEDGAELSVTQLEDAQNSGTKELESIALSTKAQQAASSKNPKSKASRTQDEHGDSAAKTPAKALSKESVVRVPSARLDRLVNLVGELVMNQSRLMQAALLAGTPELANPVQEMERLVSELRDDVLGIRMLPIGTIFGRFRRLVHDLSAELGKEVDLVTEGAETELDKSILDQLSEPLVHMLRNSIDHGIEPTDRRIELGKPRRGTIRLSAQHAGSHVVISIEDDGKGIDRSAVRAKAVEKKIISPEAILSDSDLLNLILQPGFSTAAKVTSVSGRGVGMDVVKKQIDSLRGSLRVASEQGKGSKFALSLPLTLAIIEGLIVEIGPDQFIIPMSAITENVELEHLQRTQKNGRNVVVVRGELVPYIDLRATFQIEGDPPSIEKVVIVRHGEDRVGLVVDRVLGSHQTVLQSLGRFFRNIDVVSGATIMGDGRVALILDIGSVVRTVDRQTELRNSRSITKAEQSMQRQLATS
jgi:two-component system chemotaxis sensor kinase CheA